MGSIEVNQFDEPPRATWRLAFSYAASGLIGLAIGIRCMIWNRFIGIGVCVVVVMVYTAILHAWITERLMLLRQKRESAGAGERAPSVQRQRTNSYSVGPTLAFIATGCVVMMPAMLLDRSLPAWGVVPPFSRFFLLVALPLSSVSWGLWLWLTLPGNAAPKLGPREWQFSLRSAFVVTTLASISLGILLKHPETGLWSSWVFIFSYAWIVRTVAAVRADNMDPRAGITVDVPRLAIAMFISFLVALSATIACGVSCSAVVFPIGGLMYSSQGNSMLFFPLLLLLGGTAGCTAAGLWIRFTWPRKA